MNEHPLMVWVNLRFILPQMPPLKLLCHILPDRMFWQCLCQSWICLSVLIYVFFSFLFLFFLDRKKWVFFTTWKSASQLSSSANQYFPPFKAQEGKSQSATERTDHVSSVLQCANSTCNGNSCVFVCDYYIKIKNIKRLKIIGSATSKYTM